MKDGKWLARQLKRAGDEALAYAARLDEYEKGFKKVPEKKDPHKPGPKPSVIRKDGDCWRIVSNKSGKFWPQKYGTKEDAEAALAAYQANARH